MQKLILIAGVALLAASVAFLAHNSNNNINFIGARFAEWKQLQNKQYTQVEEAYRMMVYANNVALIDAHNADPTQTYEQGENQFTDLTQEEFVATYLTYTPPEGWTPPTEEYVDNSEPNDSVDWRGSSPVKNQGQCGSCWAFSASGAIEAFYKVKKGSALNLSPQQLVDCERTYSQGCNGGYPDKAINWAAKNGITSESAYPYKGVQSTCKTSTGSTKPAGVSAVAASGLKAAVAQYPVSVCVDATNWSAYKSGTFSNCKTSINHAVLAVGYTANGEWIVKNSWGTGWGQAGHIYLAAGDTCGVTRQAAKAI